MTRAPDLVTVFLRWIWWRALLHNGWWLVTSIYLVVEGGLSASQLVLIAVAQNVVALVFEIPAGAVADAVSRKWSLVVSHVLMGTAMLATGLVTDFRALVATQMLWGVSWNFASGADVAWITDELQEPARISGVLVRSGRAQLIGAAAGIVGIGALGSLTHRGTAMVVAGAAMLLLALYVVFRFPERQFRRSARPFAASYAVLTAGSRLVRGNRAIRLIVAATFLVNGAGTFGRLYPKRLIELGFPASPVVWFAALGVLTLFVGACALSIIQPHVDDSGAAMRGYVLACAAGAVGLLALAVAPERVSGSAAAVFVAGIALPLTRTLGTIWVNRQTTADVRATVHSFLAQAEYLGEIVCGTAIAAVAAVAGLSPALVACAALFGVTVVLLRVLSPRRRERPSGNAAVDGEQDARDPRREVAGEEERRARDVILGGDPPERRAGRRLG